MEKKDFCKQLKQGLKKLDLQISSAQLTKFWRYKNFLQRENKKYNLTAADSDEEIITRHFFDSAAVFTFLEKQTTEYVFDLGSGAGFPGMVFRILFPELPLFFLDARLKRIIFLNKLVEYLAISGENLQIRHGRAEELGSRTKYREKYNTVVSRAVAPLNILCEYCLPFIKIGGFMIAYKGDDYQNELRQARNAIEILGGEYLGNENVKIPGTEINRSYLIIRKVRQTPEKFPRRPGQPKKNPL